MAVYSVQRKIRFGQTDAAGIVFYPRFVEMVNNTVEDFFSDVVGLSYRDMHYKRNLGLPTVKLEVEFFKPGLLGDLLTWSLVVTRIGNSSLGVKVTADRKGEVRMVANVDLVLVDVTDKPHGVKSVPFADAMRLVLERYFEAPAE